MPRARYCTNPTMTGQRATTSQRGVLRPHGEGTAYLLDRLPVATDLSATVERHWSVRWAVREPYPQATLPQPCVNVVFQRGASGVFGPATRRFEILLEGRGEVFGTKFRPGGFHPWLRAPVSTLTDARRPLSLLFGDEADALEAAVLAEPTDEARRARVEAALRARLPPPDPLAVEVAGIVGVALDDPRLRRVEDLCARVGVSPRTLQRRFQQYVGVSPKWVLRLFRLHEAAEVVASRRAVDFAGLAADLGYHDQAHLIRDFKAQVGRTPTAYAAWASGG